MEHKNWNYEDGTPEDGPSQIPYVYAGPFQTPLTADTQMFFSDLIAKHDAMAKLLQFTTSDSLTWLEEEKAPDAGMTDSIYAWDAAGDFHEIRIERTDPTTDACKIRFFRSKTETTINVLWNQEG
jgi:hypothetical protein